MSAAAYKVDTVEDALRNLKDLIDVICEIRFEQNPDNDDTRLNSLLWIARDLVEGIDEKRHEDFLRHNGRDVAGLIQTHKKTWAALDAATDAADNASGKAKPVAEAELGKASDATADAIVGIIEHPYTTLDDLKQAMCYLLAHHKATGDGDPGVWLVDLASALGGRES